MGLRDLFKRKKKAKKAVRKGKSKKKVTKPKKVIRKAPKKKLTKKQVTKKKAVPQKPVEISRNECPECGSSNVVIGKMTGNTICQDCGAIFAGLTPEVERKIEEVKKQG